jgi:hypothetical protein
MRHENAECTCLKSPILNFSARLRSSLYRWNSWMSGYMRETIQKMFPKTIKFIYLLKAVVIQTHIVARRRHRYLSIVQLPTHFDTNPTEGNSASWKLFCLSTVFKQKSRLHKKAVCFMLASCSLSSPSTLPIPIHRLSVPTTKTSTPFISSEALALPLL